MSGAGNVGPGKIVLAGGGHAHLGVLESWIKSPPADTQTWLITPEPYAAYSGMIPGWMSGHYGDAEHLIDLRPLARLAGVKLVLDRIIGLNAGEQQVTLGGGEVLGFDLLSLATGGEADLSSLASLGAGLLPVKPVNQFVERWPSLLAEAAQTSEYHLVIVGGGAAGVELAFAASQAFKNKAPSARLTLVAGAVGLLIGHGNAVRRQVERALQSRKIEVLICDAEADGEHLLRLSDGSTLRPNAVIAATGSRAPAWLAGSGLSLSQDGYIKIGADLRSVSHPSIFAAGDVVERVDLTMARSGVHAVKAGPVLAANLRAVLSGGKMQAYRPRRRTLYLLSTGDSSAILSWGGFSVAGRFVWWLKDWIDRAFVNNSRNMG